MKVTVSECLRLPSLREAMLIGGAKGLERSVSSVSVLEWPEVELLSDDVIAGNEVLLSALIQIKGDVEKQCRLLRHLCSMGTSCLIVYYVGVFVPEIDERLISLADEIRYPLLVMPYNRMDFRYADVITDIVEHIYSKRKQEKYLLTDMMNSISYLEPNQISIANALRLLSDRMRCTLLLTNRYMDSLGAAAWPRSMRWDYDALLQRLKNGSAASGTAELELDGKHVYVTDRPINSEVHRRLHLFVITEDRPPDNSLCTQAADVISLVLNIWSKDSTYEGTDDLIEAVLTDNPERMRVLASRMDVKIEDIHTMWCFSIKHSGEPGPRKHGDTLVMLRHFLLEYYKLVIVDNFGSYLIALTDDSFFETDCKSLGNDFAKRFEREGFEVRSCVFERLDNTTQTREAYLRMSENFKALCTVFPHRKAHTDSDVKFIRTCREYIAQGETAVAEKLSPISRIMSAADGEELAETLAVFLLDAESSMSRAGELLFLHKNTVNYRINKIKRLLTSSLDSLPGSFEVYQALSIYRMWSSLEND